MENSWCFSDEVGEEHVKIVKNELIKQTDFPDTYIVDDIVYDIKLTNTTGDFVFWNKNTGGSQNNNWPTAGLQYWLNAGSNKETNQPSDGYMSYLSKNAKDMIENNTKYYLGMVTYKYINDSDFGIIDTAVEAYANERAVKECNEEKGPVENSNQTTLQNNATCRVWANNDATWIGKIALLYQSDYGYSADSQYWNTKLDITAFNGTPSDSSRLQKTSNHSKFHEWFLSPSSGGFYVVANWFNDGYAGDATATSRVNLAVRPTLYLKSNVKITEGKGSELETYKLILE